jgi:hypothetical protein
VRIPTVLRKGSGCIHYSAVPAAIIYDNIIAAAFIFYNYYNNE